MTISLHRQFIDQVLKPPTAVRAVIFDAVLLVPDALQNPSKHTGLGLRKLHRSGIWKVRIGLGLRALLQLQPDQTIFRFLGTHDEMR
ncbi:MAG TPA: hypothetical protein VK137_18920 [Planctomycetaceae bacterium]|nr:hypothetical protein [Planctomycetaceae bacterium]